MPKLNKVVAKEETERIIINGFSQKEEVNEKTSSKTSSHAPDLLETEMLQPKETEKMNDTVTTGLLQDKNDSQHGKFDQFLIEAINEALSSLGEPVKNTVYLHLQNDFGIEKSEIPSKIEEFSDILHKIFGLGASRLEIKFMKNLNSKIKVNIQWPEYEYPLSKWIIMEVSFIEYVYNMRKNYEVECQKKE